MKHVMHLCVHIYVHCRSYQNNILLAIKRPVLCTLTAFFIKIKAAVKT